MKDQLQAPAWHKGMFEALGFSRDFQADPRSMPCSLEEPDLAVFGPLHILTKTTARMQRNETLSPVLQRLTPQLLLVLCELALLVPDRTTIQLLVTCMHDLFMKLQMVDADAAQEVHRQEHYTTCAAAGWASSAVCLQVGTCTCVPVICTQGCCKIVVTDLWTLNWAGTNGIRLQAKYILRSGMCCARQSGPCAAAQIQ